MKKLIPILLLVAGIVAFTQDGKTPTVDEIFSKLDAANDAMKSFEAKFTQEEIDEFGDKSTFGGKIYFLSPGRMKITRVYQGETIEEVAKNETSAWRVQHRLKKVDRVPSQEKGQLSGGFNITSADDLHNSFNFVYKGTDSLNSGEAWHLEGTAKETGEIRKIEIWINKGQLAPIVKIISYKRDDIIQTFELNNVRLNIKLDEKMFAYRLPRGYQEIKY